MLPVASLRKAVEEEWNNIERYDMPWSRRLWLYRHGFTTARDAIYDLSRANVDDYLSDVQHQKGYWSQFDINEKPVSKNKLLFFSHLSETHPQHSPDVYGLLSLTTGFDSLDDRVSTLEDVADLAQDRALIVKPKTGFSGGDVHSIRYGDGAYLFDGEQVSRAGLFRRLQSFGDDVILMGFVESAPYAKQISPKSGNTIRVLAFVHPETNESFISTAVHRFGTRQSGAADNWSQGGLSVAIDQDTGTLGKAVTSPKSEHVERLRTHPDTDQQITGVQIPDWDKIKENILTVTDDYSHLLRYVGWDIIVTGDGGAFKIVEANSGSDVDLLQTHEPLLECDKTREFYEYYDIL